MRLRARGIDVLLATGMDTVDSPLIRATRGRVGIFNSHVWSMARRHGAYVLDVWGMRSLRDWRMWSEDRIHLTSEGHARVAQAALVALGLDPDDPAWDDPLTPLPPVPPAERLRSNIDWLRHHVYPWATRRLRRRSAGDLRVPKRPAVAPLEPPPTGTATDQGGGTLDGAAAGGEDLGHTLDTTPGAPTEGREDAPRERTTVSDRIDFTTSDDLVQPEGVDAVRRSRTGPRDVLSGGHPERAPGNLAERFEEKEGLVGASPDGSPAVVEAYETGQDDGQIV
jgi:hypothetical protein